jgi:hypothetical protein
MGANTTSPGVPVSTWDGLHGNAAEAMRDRDRPRRGVSRDLISRAGSNGPATIRAAG